MTVRRIALMVAVGAALIGSTVLLKTRDRPGAREASTPLGVDQLAKDPNVYTDRLVTLEGVVAATLPAESLFTIIDRSEYEACRVVTCSQYQVPVAFAGELPPAEQSVSVTGRLVQPEPGRFLLQASRVERLP